MKLSTGVYKGEYSSQKLIDGLIITKTLHQQYTGIEKHFHINPYYCFVLKGGYDEFYKNEKLSLNKGDLIFHPSCAEHRNEFKTVSTTCLNIEFSKVWLNRFDKDLPEKRQNLLVKDVNQKMLLMKIYQELEHPDQFSELIILGLATELTRQMLRVKDVSLVYLEKVKTYIDQHPFSSPRLVDLSQVAKVSEEHLCRSFKLNYGQTLGEYVRLRKIETACKLLHKKSISMEQIAFDLGFTDNSHFTKSFKKIMGISPAKFRDKC
jgi:AraC family transcriptional regulator